MVRVELAAQRLVAISLGTERVPAGRSTLPPDHPPGPEEGGSDLTALAHLSPIPVRNRNKPLT